MPNPPDFDLIETHVMQAVKGNAFAEEVGRALVRHLRSDTGGASVDDLLAPDGWVHQMALNVNNPPMVSFPRVAHMVQAMRNGNKRGVALFDAMQDWLREEGVGVPIHLLGAPVGQALFAGGLVSLKISEAVKDALEEQSMLELLDESAAEVLADIQREEGRQ